MSRASVSQHGPLVMAYGEEGETGEKSREGEEGRGGRRGKRGGTGERLGAPEKKALQRGVRVQRHGWTS